MVYRWVKTYFSLNSAVDSSEYTKENFNISVKITDWNWWRIVWNYILIFTYVFYKRLIYENNIIINYTNIENKNIESLSSKGNVEL